MKRTAARAGVVLALLLAGWGVWRGERGAEVARREEGAGREERSRVVTPLPAGAAGSVLSERGPAWHRVWDGAAERARVERAGPGTDRVVTRWVCWPGKFSNVVVREVVSSAGNVRRDAAWVADHVLVRRPAGLGAEAFRAEVSRRGGEVAEELGGSGWVRVRLREAGLTAVEEAVAGWPGAEPDYLRFTAEVEPAVMPQDPMDGVVQYPEAHTDSAHVGPPGGQPVYAPSEVERQAAERLAAAPAGSVLVGFDPPLGSGGGIYRPYREQGFRFSQSNGVYVQNAYTSGYPQNGGYYARTLATDQMVVDREDGVPFQAVSVDLSEYSTVYARPTTLTFRGVRANGAQVLFMVTLDGVIDGTGPLADFQTVLFPPSFTNLVRVESLTPMFMSDNWILSSTATVPPVTGVLPTGVVYQVTWEPPEHVVGQTTRTGGPYAPSSVIFGNPVVRAAVGTLSNALEFCSVDVSEPTFAYEQIGWNLSRGAERYEVEYDLVRQVAGGTFAYLVDGMGSLIRMDITSTGSLTLFVQGGTTVSYGTVPLQRVVRFRLITDRAARTFTILTNGVTVGSAAFTGQGDVTTMRFSLGDTNRTAVIGMDNVVIRATGMSNAPALPVLSVTPSRLDFPVTGVGLVSTQTLSLANAGTSDLKVTGAAVTPAVFGMTPPTNVVLRPGEQLAVAVTYRPSASGTVTGVVTIVSNDPARSRVTVPVSGVGVSQPVCRVAPDALNLHGVAGAVARVTLCLSNAGSGALHWNWDTLYGTNLPSVVPVVPRDASYPALWGLSSSSNAIRAPQAWALTQGATSVVVAVIDTGIDTGHPDLAGNAWVNLGEIAGNGVDDDRNGYVDDRMGYNFSARTASPTDGHGHGTHVAGTIAAAANTSLVCGVAPRTRVMALKFLADTGYGYTSDAVLAVDYAAAMGARVLNNSWGGGGYSQALLDAIRRAGARGVLFLAAAGNASTDDDATSYYPACYAASNLMAIASTDSSGALSYFSNYGRRTVPLAAPGSSVLSLAPGGGVATKSGTSMATPHVSGVAALMLARWPQLQAPALMEIMQLVATPVLTNRVGAGRVDAFRSVATVPLDLSRLMTTAGTLGPGGCHDWSLPLMFGTSPGSAWSGIGVIRSDDAQRPRVWLPVSLNVLTNTPYLGWAWTTFANGGALSDAAQTDQWGGEADPDHDGQGNLLEYALGSSPLSGGRGSAVVATRGADGVEFRYSRRVNSGVRLVPEWSSDLVTWSADPVRGEERVEPGRDGIEWVVLRPRGGGPRQFVRLRAVEPGR